MTATPMPPVPFLDELVDELRVRNNIPGRARRRAIRKAVNATVDEAARACGVSRFSIYRWERPDGTVEPQGADATAYSLFLDKLKDLALDFKGEPPQK